ncbi:hypothetical protein [Thalassococcus sp. S3]|uniref:hypothetical protein n=1 Tax=Thalassococcus sp. S3 TaxID=2017482 RepID=UPI0010248F66|nr:hypothetical protein [Thalassococcus sp. S3]QBF32712.1 hypothetical protein CFI11_16035 [Thalassococcus sp. S3]
MRRIALAAMMMPAMAFAESWLPLTGDEVRSALEARTLIYDNGARQEFLPSGRTLYSAGEDSWGYWRVEGDRYCSTWPPSDLWACYALERSGDKLRFVGASGDVIQGVYAE